MLKIRTRTSIAPVSNEPLHSQPPKHPRVHSQMLPLALKPFFTWFYLEYICRVGTGGGNLGLTELNPSPEPKKKLGNLSVGGAKSTPSGSAGC